MAEQFNAAGIESISLVGESKDEERKTAKDRLVKGELRFIFVVDIYNEGVDIPEVNTVLFLRPTESLTIFLQQLGLCDFVKYEGSRPMNITWKLRRAIPAKYLRKTGKLVV